MKPILVEDDSAPDAYKYFARYFEEITSMTIEEFKARALNLSGYDYLCFVTNGYRLEYHADDPYHKLYRL